MINLIAKSLWNRKGTALLTLFSIAISVALLIGVEQIRKGGSGPVFQVPFPERT